jgi:hypothetical protein
MAKVKTTVKAVKVKLTAGRIADFKCTADKQQTFLWCDTVPGLSIRATANGAKPCIFQAKVRGKSMRLTISDVSVWSIADAQTEGHRLQSQIDNGDGQHQVKTDKESAKIAAQQAKESEAAALVMQEARKAN